MTIGPRGARAAAFLMPWRTEAADPADDVWQHCRDSRADLGVGAGDYVSLGDLAKSHEQAIQAAPVVDAIGSGAGRLWYPRVGVLGVIASAAASTQFAAFSNSLLAPVRAYDAQHEVEGLTGLTLERSVDRLQLELAALVVKLGETSAH